MKNPLALLAAIVATLSAAAAERIVLFNGNSLLEWEGDTAKTWRIVDRVIVGGSLAGNPRNEFLATLRGFRNFELTLEYKLTGTEGFVNGGVQFRSRRIASPANEMSGYQADIGAGYSGALYDESRRKRTLAKPDPAVITRIEKPGEWNTYQIRCEGPRIRLLLNGTPTVDYTETEPGIEENGLIALQIHGNCKAEIAFRNISLVHLSDPDIPSETEILQRFGGEGPTKRASIDAWRDGKFAVEENDMIALVGQTNFVRAQRTGALEERLALAFTHAQPRVRWMAWEGDTVYEQWRDLNFGSWRSQLDAVGATILIAQFGQLEALDGLERLPSFKTAYDRLLQQLAGRTPRLVLVSPMPFEKPPQTHVPDLSVRNPVVKAYAETVRALARQHGAIFVDLFEPLSRSTATLGPLTDNGMHLNDEGLRAVATLIADRLGVGASLSLSEANLTALRRAIIEKNRLWFDCWRPANWSFVYGDRVKQPFAQPTGDMPALHETFENLKPLIAAMDQRIRAAARGEPEAAGAFYADVPGLVARTDDVRNAKGRPRGTLLPVVTPDELTSSPAEEEASFTLADGYAVNLFASEVDGVVKPTQIAWDERGRLYVACSPSYPHTMPGAKPADYILLLEDTDGDGRADRTHRYAEGLTMTQGVEPGGGGVYVCDYDQLLHLRDTDGDGRADERRVIFSGFGVGDTHQMINSISHGPDGALWFTQGYHTFSRVETPWGLARLDKAGIWRLQPRTLELDAFFNGAKAGHNCWGVVFDDFNQVFHKSGDRPAGYYTVPGLAKVTHPDEYHPTGALFDTNPKTTALDLIGTRGLPDDVQGCAVVAGYFGNVMEFHRIIDDGAGFKSEQLPKLLRSTSTSFRPVDVGLGPDGAIYVADWFNPIIGHYQASYADPRRDRSHGRIWRITAKGRPPIKPPDLASMSPEQLLEQLRSPERWVRYQAKRLLFDAPSSKVLASADAWVAKLDPRALDTERLLLDAIGIYESHQSPRPDLLMALLRAKDARVRAYGTRVIGAWRDRLPSPLELLRARIKDEHPRVRLEAVVACSYIAKPESAEVATQAIDSPRDRFIDYALAQTLRGLQPIWQPELEAGRLTFGGDETRLEFARTFATTPRAGTHPGKAIYDNLCLNCHQPDAKGLPGIYPPLVNREWVAGDKNLPIKVVLHGLVGPITVGGETYGAAASPPMPPSSLNDTQVADVLTYLRINFGNHAPPISVAEVKAVREKTADRTTPWTAVELRP